MDEVPWVIRGSKRFAQTLFDSFPLLLSFWQIGTRHEA